MTHESLSIKINNSVDNYLLSCIFKTCFGPDKIVEIINEKNEVFSYKKINLADGIQGNLKNK